MLAHLRRYLRPGGTLMLTTPNGAYFRSKLPTHSQVEDYAARKDMSIAEVERWLAPILNYDPASYRVMAAE